jgi:hypothetical protein
MSVLPVGFGESDSGIETGDIANSLRFRGAQYISTTLTTAATSTYFAAVKRGKLGVISPIFDSSIKFNANDTLTAFGLTTTAVFRDPTSWLFIHVSNGGLYVNGVSHGAVTTSALTNPRIGYDGTNYFDGYMARVSCLSGSSSAYSNFGSTNSGINEWITKTAGTIKALVDAGGSPGFMYEFNDPATLTTLGNDYSSKNNDGTLTGGFSLSGVTYDHMSGNGSDRGDVPGNSYAVLNPLAKYGGTLTNGNLTISTTAGESAWAFSSIAFDAADDFYCEFVCTGDASGTLGAKGVGVIPTTLARQDSGAFPFDSVAGYGYMMDGTRRTTGSQPAYGSAWGNGNTIGIRLAAGTLTFYRDGVSQGTAWSGLSGSFVFVVGDGTSGGGITGSFIFGANPFTQTTPTTRTALCQANLTDPAILNPREHFDAKTYIGNAFTGQTLTTGFETGLVWAKDRGTAYHHAIYDSVRGIGKTLVSSSTNAETTESAGRGVTAFGSTGVTLGGDPDVSIGSINASGENYVSWNWKAGGTGVSNTAGSITSTVSANVEAGFSIVTYTGTGANATVGHGLGVAPKMVIVKQRDSGTNHWQVYHEGAGAGYTLFLNLTDARLSDATAWNSTAPSSTVVSLGTRDTANGNGRGYVAYCFAEIPGYSKIGSYVGNGSADGPFVECGFKPRWVLIKRTDVGGYDWYLMDTQRPATLPQWYELYADLSSAEATGPSTELDYLSNGFKLRMTNAGKNANGGTYIFYAIADVSAKFSLAR